MASKSQEPKWRDGALSSLSVAIEALNLAKEVSSVTPATAVFASVIVLLTMIRDSMANEQDYVELGMNCADVCNALNRGLNGRRLGELSEPVLEAIKQFTTTVAAIQKKIVKQGKRNAMSRVFHAKSDKETIAIWRQDLTRVLHIFNTELAINTHMLVVDIHRNVLTGQEGAYGQHQSTQGELPPPAPRTCFGRDELIEKLVSFAENLEPVALIGAGGIGKTSIALTVLHHNRIKHRFGDHRRFIRCDQFLASRAHFLARLSKVIGAGVENPEDLIPLRPFLSSQNILIVLDNAESVLDPQGTDAGEIYGIVDELCQLKTICLCITSRLTTVPGHCKLLMIPTLSMEAARDMFYAIHSNGEQSAIADDLLRRLDFHALSITLLATTASHNMWDFDELAKAWDIQREQVLRTDYNEGLAATIELSLASPTFRKLGEDARDLLGVVAFFPQGVDERNLDSFFPNIFDRQKIFSKFRILSLTHRINGFITMLAPMRDYLCPRDPKSSPLLCAVKDRYFSWLSVQLYPGEPGFEDGRWIKSEDVNVEHLLNVFTGTSIDTNTDDVWNACAHFMQHLFWHKNRYTVLGSKINGLPDEHPSKPGCLLELSTLLQGNCAEQKRLLSHVLRLERERGHDVGVASTLVLLSETNRMLKLYKIAIPQAKEASEILKRLGHTKGLATSLICLAFLLHSDKQLDAAEEAASRAMRLLPEKGHGFLVCQSDILLGKIYGSKGEREKATHHFETALGVASTFNLHSQLSWAHCSIAELFFNEDELGYAQAHIEQAKSHAVATTSSLLLGAVMMHQALILFRHNKLEDARSEALGALEICEKLGAADYVGVCRDLVQAIEQAMDRNENSLGGSENIFGKLGKAGPKVFDVKSAPIFHEQHNRSQSEI